MKTQLRPEAFGLSRSLVCRHWWRRRSFFGSCPGQHIYLCDPCREVERPHGW